MTKSRRPCGFVTILGANGRLRQVRGKKIPPSIDSGRRKGLVLHAALHRIVPPRYRRDEGLLRLVALRRHTGNAGLKLLDAHSLLLTIKLRNRAIACGSTLTGAKTCYASSRSVDRPEAGKHCDAMRELAICGLRDNSASHSVSSQGV